jgi:hypothetical protein
MNRPLTGWPERDTAGIGDEGFESQTQFLKPSVPRVGLQKTDRSKHAAKTQTLSDNVRPIVINVGKEYLVRTRCLSERLRLSRDTELHEPF